MTLDNASEKWLSVRKAEVAPNTHRIDSERMKALCARLGSRTLISLRPEDIRNYQHERRSEVSARTVNLETKVLRLLLTEAHLWTRFEPYFKPLRENRRGPGRALTAEQHEQLFKVVMSDPNASSSYFAAIIAAETTMRGCELKGLRVADIDLIGGVVRVHRITTKTDAGERTIPLTKAAVWCFGQLLKRAELLGSTKAEHYLFPRFVFRDKRTPGTGLGYDPTKHQVSFRTGWKNLLKRAGLPKLRFHTYGIKLLLILLEQGIADPINPVRCRPCLRPDARTLQPHPT